MLDDAWGAVAELAASRHGAFTRAQAASQGLDHRRIATAVAAKRVAARGGNVFVFADHPRSPRQDLTVATLLGAGSVASHRSAAWLHGFDGFADDPVSAEVSVARPRWLRVPKGLHVIAHQTATLPAADVVDHDGIACTGKARTLADLGAVVSAGAVLRALIGAHRDGLSLPVARRTALALHRPGQAGTGVLLRHLDALARAGRLPESWLEEVLRQLLQRPDFPPLVQQYELRDRSGRVVARFDHAFPAAKLAIEGHSRQFHFGPLRESLDEDRDLRAARLGWEIIYLGWYAAKRPQEVVAAVADVLSHRVAA